MFPNIAYMDHQTRVNLIGLETGPRIECVTENYFCYFSTKTYVVGTQKNRLDKTVCLSTKTYV